MPVLKTAPVQPPAPVQQAAPEPEENKIQLEEVFIDDPSQPAVTQQVATAADAALSNDDIDKLLNS